MKKTILEWVFAQGFIFLIKMFDKFGKEPFEIFLNNVIVKADDKLDKSLGKEKSKIIWQELSEIISDINTDIKKEMED